MNEFNHTAVNASEACGFTEEEKQETFNVFDDIVDILISDANMSQATENIEVLVKETNISTRQLIYALIKAHEFMIHMAFEATNSTKTEDITPKEISGNV